MLGSTVNILIIVDTRGIPIHLSERLMNAGVEMLKCHFVSFRSFLKRLSQKSESFQVHISYTSWLWFKVIHTHTDNLHVFGIIFVVLKVIKSKSANLGLLRLSS